MDTPFFGMQHDVGAPLLGFELILTGLHLPAAGIGVGQVLGPAAASKALVMSRQALTFSPVVTSYSKSLA